MIEPDWKRSNPHDGFFKELFSRPEVAADFLANYLPPEIVAPLDLGSLELMKDSFVDDALRNHLSDLLYQVKLKSGGSAYVCLLFEHKSEPYDWVAWQVLRYKVRAWELELRQGATKLPPIIPIVFYHGRQRWQVPREFSALIDFGGHDRLREFEPDFRYYFCDLSSLDASQIKGIAILQAGLQILRTIFTDEFEETLEDVFDLLLREKEPGAMEHLRTILRYTIASRKKLTATRLQAVVENKVPKPEAISLMETIAEVWMQQGVQQKTAEIELELVARVLKMLQRFGPIEPGAQERIRTFSFKRLVDLMEAIVDFKSAEDFAAWMRQQEQTELETAVN
jgi:predicted transposase/invertase (TIGR01784 family)